ncbi:MAG: peptidoglycan-binding protein [Pseudomonadota bacterium]
MTRPIRLAAAWLLCLAAATGAARAADLALVVGNGDYRAAPQAVAARPDARAVAAALEEGGYDVIRGLDLDRAEMRARLSEFAGRVGEADNVVVFYSGHALRAEGRSFLAPTDQAAGSLVEVMMDGVPLDLVLRLAAEGRGEAVVFLDGAQLDGFRPTDFAEPGLAEIERPEGVLVVSAAPPGRAIARRSAGRSAFGRQVVEGFLAPGASVADGVRGLDSPSWVAGDTDVSLVLVPEGRAPEADEPARDEERVDRREDRDDGRLRPSEAEDRLNLSSGERRRIQIDLNSLGYDTRGVDGIFGPGSRRAIERWQGDSDLRVTGYLDEDQIGRLREQAERTRAGDREAREAADRAWWRETGERGTEQGYRDYLARYPDGIHAEEARRELERREADEGAAARERERELGLSREDRRSVEQRLDALGFDPGATDGYFDADARSAIRSYQRSRGERATGYLDEPTVQRLVSETRELDAGAAGTRLLLDILRGLAE